MSSKVIVIGGLPGTGKTSIATMLSRSLGIPVYTKDLLEAAIVRCKLSTPESLDGVGYELLKVLALEALARNQGCILDCIASSERVERFWGDLVGADLCYIECLCTNSSLHRERLENRERNIPGWYEPTWEDVVAIGQGYRPWSETRLVLDATNDIHDNLARALAYVERNHR